MDLHLKSRTHIIFNGFSLYITKRLFIATRILSMVLKNDKKSLDFRTKEHICWIMPVKSFHNELACENAHSIIESRIRHQFFLYVRMGIVGNILIGTWFLQLRLNIAIFFYISYLFYNTFTVKKLCITEYQHVLVMLHVNAKIGIIYIKKDGQEVLDIDRNLLKYIWIFVYSLSYWVIFFIFRLCSCKIIYLYLFNNSF